MEHTEYMSKYLKKVGFCSWKLEKWYVSHTSLAQLSYIYYQNSNLTFLHTYKKSPTQYEMAC